MKTKAFTLAEMMVVLLVISLAMAAFTPIITKRIKSSGGGGGGSGSSNSIWQYVGGSTPADIYTNEGATLGAIIGTDSFGGGESAKLLLNTSQADQPHILFKQTVAGISTKTGYLNVDANGNIGLGNMTIDATTPKIRQISIGKSAHTYEDESIAIGYNTESHGPDSIAIGSAATAKTSTSNSTYQSIAIGTSTNADGWQCIAMGPYARATSSVTSDPAMAIGESAQATDRNTTAIGTQSKAIHSFSTAIGVDATSTAPHQIVLGTKNETVIIPGRLKVGIISEVARGGNYLSNVQFTQSSLGDYYTLNAYGASTAYDDRPNSIISDRRLKNVKGENISGLEQIRKIKTYNYTLKNDKHKTPRVGVMAQDLKLIFPDAVDKAKDGYFRIRQEDMFYAMLNAIKQLDMLFQKIEAKISELVSINEINSKRIEELELKNSSLEEQNKIFEDRLNKLEKR